MCCSLFFQCVFLLTKNNTISSPGFLGQQFNNLQWAALLTSLVQYDKDSLQIWPTAAGYGELCVGNILNEQQWMLSFYFESMLLFKTILC